MGDPIVAVRMICKTAKEKKKVSYPKKNTEMSYKSPEPTTTKRKNPKRTGPTVYPDFLVCTKNISKERVDT